MQLSINRERFEQVTTSKALHTEARPATEPLIDPR
jgi:hypothetical protein